MDQSPDTPTPKIVYPCPWEYAVIGTEEETIRAGILSVMAGRSHKLVFSHRSKQGKYCSFHLSLIVDNEPYRNQLYTELKKIPTVIQVL